LRTQRLHFARAGYTIDLSSAGKARFFQRAPNTLSSDTFNKLEADKFISDHAQRPLGFTIWCFRARNFDDLRFNTTVNLDGLAFVFSGFAVKRGFESVLTEFLADTFDRMGLHTQVLSNLGVLMVGSVRIGLEQDAGSGDGLCWVFASSGEAG
jgi:hypothetical protein